MNIIPGLAFPYFPPRPTTGTPITIQNVRSLVEVESRRYFLSPKLGGDRGMLLVKDRQVVVANRFAKIYSFTVKNAKSFLKLPDLTILDGEIWKGEFRPFEVVVVGGKSFCKACPSIRSFEARRICAEIGQKYLFDLPVQKWFNRLKNNLPEWEGVVKKRLGSPYIPLATADQSSPYWIKSKW